MSHNDDVGGREKARFKEASTLRRQGPSRVGPCAAKAFSMELEKKVWAPIWHIIEIKGSTYVAAITDILLVCRANSGVYITD